MKGIHSEQAFTLLEMIITLVILSAMTLLISTSLQQSVKFKKTLQLEMDQSSRIRDVLHLMESDIQLAFHFVDYNQQIELLLKKKRSSGTAQNPGATQPPQTPVTPEPPAEAPPIDPETHFVGTEKTLDFVTMNNTSFFSSTPSADFVTVGYSVRSCRSLAEEKELPLCLWRRLSPHVGPDPTRGGETVAILENVTEFKLKYLGREKDDWIKDWRSNASSDAAATHSFPDAVEISLTIKNEEAGKTRAYSYQTVVALHFPNNLSREERNAKR